LNQSGFSKNENDKYLGTEGESPTAQTRGAAVVRGFRIIKSSLCDAPRETGRLSTKLRTSVVLAGCVLCSLDAKKRIRGKEDSLPFKRLFPHVLKKFRRMRWTRNSSVYANGEALRLLVAGWAACRPTAENSEL